MPQDKLFRAFFASPVGGTISGPNRRCLRSIGRLVSLNRRETLTLDRISFVGFGHVKWTCVLAGGQEHILAFAGAGKMLMADPNDDSSQILTALESCSILTFPTDAFLEAVSVDPSAFRAFLRVSAKQIDALRIHSTRLATLTACERVTAFLLDLIVGSDEEAQLYLPMSRSEIGDHLNITIETTSRCISRLKAQGLIFCPARDQILIPNRTALLNYRD